MPAPQLAAKWGRGEAVGALYLYNQVNCVTSHLSSGLEHLCPMFLLSAQQRCSSWICLPRDRALWCPFEERGETHNEHLDVGEEAEVTLLTTKTSRMQCKCWEAN